VRRAGALALLAGVAAGRALRLRRRERARATLARELAQRALRQEAEVRRQVAEALHHGPVQELISLDMVLASAAEALRRDDHRRGGELLAEARELAARNVKLLRQELVELGPALTDDERFEAALERCRPVWERRYGVRLTSEITSLDLEPEIANCLFRITQEAVANAGRHGEADNIAVGLRAIGSELELRVADDGRGLDADPLAEPQAGHLGLASVRERAEGLGGSMQLDSTGGGTQLLVRLPR